MTSQHATPRHTARRHFSTTQHADPARTAFDEANDAILILDEDGNILDCNSKACQVFGYCTSELHGIISAISSRICNNRLSKISCERLRIQKATSGRSRSSGRIVDSEWTYANPEAGRILKRSPEDLVGACLLELLPNNAKERELFDRHVRIVDTGRGDEVELEYNHEGITGWFRNMTVKLGDGVAVSFSDVTARKNAENSLRNALEERTLLLRELDHRVKNSFTIMDSLVRLERDQSSDPIARTALDNLDRRMRTLSRLYVVLQSSGEINTLRLDVYLADVARSILNTFADSPGRFTLHLDLDELLVSTRHASPFGLILNELLSSCFTYAFPGGRKGTLTVTLRRGDTVVFEVKDDGVGLPAGFDIAASTSTGFSLIRMLVQQHIGGEYAVQSDGGMRFVIRVNKQNVAPPA
jgi:two-component sensor histidine kinase/PAS domain-containing protein